MSGRTANRRWYRVVFGYVGLRDVPWAGLAWVLAAATVFSLLIRHFFPDTFPMWISTFVATLLSVLAGVFVYRHQVNRREIENLYRLYMILDADIGAMLWRLDSSISGGGPLEVKLPSGSVASARPSLGEKDESMFDEIARAGRVKSRHETLSYLILASAVRAYGKASSNYISLVEQASLASHVGPNTEQALIHAANHVERLRKSLIKMGAAMRQNLSDLLAEYEDANPWGLENVEASPDLSELLRNNAFQDASLQSDNLPDGEAGS